MQWIDEMFVNMEKDRAAALAKTGEKAAKVDRTELVKKQTAATLNAWKALVRAITRCINEFNNHDQRAGQIPVRISKRYLECGVHVPGDGRAEYGSQIRQQRSPRLGSS